MAKIHAYLNFNGNCEQAFAFYEKAFKTKVTSQMRFGDMPPDPNYNLSSEDQNKILHTGLNISPDIFVMGSDVVASFGQQYIAGNNSYVMLDVDTAEEAKELYNSLSENAKKIEMALGETFFAEQYASFIDQFDIPWMIHFEGNRKGTM